MSGIVRWNPTSSSLFDRALGQGFGRLMDDFFSSPGRGQEEDVSATRWAPATDIKETEDAIFAYVELPGMRKKDIDVSVENNVLTVSGERGFDESKASFHRVERFYGKFSRSFRLPRNVDAGKVKAHFADGLLTLELPKSEESKPRQIAIN